MSHHRDHDNSTNSFGVALIFGLIGAAIGMLFAPKSGRETREDLKSRANDMQGKAGETAGKVKTVVKENAEEVKGSLRRSAKEMAELGEEAKLRASRIADDARSTGHKVEENTRRRMSAEEKSLVEDELRKGDKTLKDIDR